MGYEFICGRCLTSMDIKHLGRNYYGERLCNGCYSIDKTINEENKELKIKIKELEKELDYKKQELRATQQTFEDECENHEETKTATRFYIREESKQKLQVELLKLRVAGLYEELKTSKGNFQSHDIMLELEHEEFVKSEAKVKELEYKLEIETTLHKIAVRNELDYKSKLDEINTIRGKWHRKEIDDREAVEQIIELLQAKHEGKK